MIKIKEGGHLGRFVRQRGIQDVLVVVERTWNYHQATRRAFVKASFDTRLLSAYGGFATKPFRLPANPGDKTDNNDFEAVPLIPVWRHRDHHPTGIRLRPPSRPSQHRTLKQPPSKRLVEIL